MADPIIQLTANEFEEAMDFLNLVFSAYGPHDFAHMLPCIYRPTDEQMTHNYAIRQGGRIRAMVGMFPILWQVGEVVLQVAGIGGVSTHPNYRGRGLMKALMTHCVGLMWEQGYHLSWLGGQRQRYRYFGYELCGNKIVFKMNKDNIRHSFKEEPVIHFEPISAQDRDRISRAKALHDAHLMHSRRSCDDFYRRCVGWRHRPLAGLDAREQMVGYLVASKGGDLVTELSADNDALALQMVHSWIAQHSQHTAILEMSPLSGELVYHLGWLSEQILIKPSGNWQVFDWPATIDALMKIRCQNGSMPDGSVVVGIKGYSALQLQVDGDQTHCVTTDEGPDVQCDAPTAMRLLFGPLSPSQVMALPAQATLLEAWCPLPLDWLRQDWV